MSIIDQMLNNNVKKRKSLTHCLAEKGMAHKRVIEMMVEEVFELKPHELWDLIKIGGDAPKGQNYAVPMLHDLDAIWKENRDPDWLYDHPMYWIETLSCAYYYTNKTVVDPAIDFLYQEGFAPKNILDWGAGSGLSSLQLAMNFPEAQVYYYEISPTCIKMFNWFKSYFNLPNLHHITELPDVEFDAIFYIEVVNHIQRPMEAIDPALAKLRIGGVMAQQTAWSFELRHDESLGHFLEYWIDDYWTDKLRACNRVFDRALENRGIYRVKSGNLSRSPLWYVRTMPHPEVLPSLAETLTPAKPLQFAGKTCSLCRTPGHSKKNCPDARLYPEGHYSRPWEVQSPPIWEGNPEDKYVQSFVKVWTKEEIENYVPSNIPNTRLLPTRATIIDVGETFKASSVEINRLLKTIDSKKLPDEIDGVLQIFAGGFKVTIENWPNNQIFEEE